MELRKNFFATDLCCPNIRCDGGMKGCACCCKWQKVAGEKLVKLSLRHVSIRNDWKVHSSFYVCMKYYCLSYLYTFFLNGYLYTIKCSLVQHICNIFLENPFILPPFDTIGIFVYFSINCRLVQHIILKNIMYISCFLILFFLYLKYHWFCSFN